MCSALTDEIQRLAWKTLSSQTLLLQGVLSLTEFRVPAPAAGRVTRFVNKTSFPSDL